MILKRGDRVIVQFSIPGVTTDRTTPAEAQARLMPTVDRMKETLKSQGVEMIAWEAHSKADQISILAVFRDEE